MKLSQIFEYDVSDYQRGDENNPRSPYYKGDPPEYEHDTDDDPIFKARLVNGQSPRGEPYNVEIIAKWRGDHKSVSYAIADTVIDALLSNMPVELVHDEINDRSNRDPMAPQFYKVYFQLDQPNVDQIQQQINDLVAELGPEVGERYYKRHPPNRNDDY